MAKNKTADIMRERALKLLGKQVRMIYMCGPEKYGMWGLLVKVGDGFTDDPKSSLKLHIPTEDRRWWIRLNSVIDIEPFET